MRLQCTLHVGAPKTGSTSIQNALFFDLRDSAFQYAAGGDPNGSIAATCIYESPPSNQWAFIARGRPARSFVAYRSRLERRLKRAYSRAVERRSHLVISAESVWLFGREGMHRLRDELESLGFACQVVAYVRPWVPWYASSIQQTLKSGRKHLTHGHPYFQAITDVQRPIELLIETFGRESVRVHRFVAGSFPEGCVVRHFCQQIGWPVPEGKRWQANETLSLPAAQLMYAFNRYGGPVGEFGPPLPVGYGLLATRLQELAGPKFQLHSSFMAPILAAREAEDSWIRRECGFSLLPDGPIVDSEHSIATDEDMLMFAPSTLDWLAARTGSRVIKPTTRDATARAVVVQLDRLRRQFPSPAEVCEWARHRLRMSAVLMREVC